MNTRTAACLLLILAPAAALSAPQDPTSRRPARTVVKTRFNARTALTDVAAIRPIPKVIRYANCDQSTAFPIININDLQCFLAKAAAGDSYANCDGSTGQPLITANDLQCFLDAYAAANAWQTALIAQTPRAR